MLFLDKKDVRVRVMGGGCHSGCFAELGRDGSEGQFEMVVAKNANPLLKELLRWGSEVGGTWCRL